MQALYSVVLIQTSMVENRLGRVRISTNCNRTRAFEGICSSWLLRFLLCSPSVSTARQNLRLKIQGDTAQLDYLWVLEVYVPVQAVIPPA